MGGYQWWGRSVKIFCGFKAIKNYLKVSARNLLRHKGSASINILGLAVGIAASVLIFLYITHEMSYDQFHEKADRTYRITADWSNKGDSRVHQLGTPYILAQTIRENYPEVESISQVSGPLGDVIIRYRDTAFRAAQGRRLSAKAAHPAVSG